jgi:O-antigen/teichoic acid export membrane protein
MIRRVASGIGANIFDKIVISGMQLALVPVLAGAWGVHLYGLWMMLFTAPAFLAMGDFGFATAAGTKMTMAVARGEHDEATHIFQSAWVAILASSAALVLLAALLALLLPISAFGANAGMSPDEIRLTLFLLVVYGLVAIQGSIFFAGFRCAGLFAVGAFCHAIIVLIENCAMIGAVLMGARPVTAAALILVGRIVGLVGQNVLLRRSVPWLEIGFRRATRAETRNLIAPAGAVMLVPIAQAFYLQGSALALGIAAGQAAVPGFTAARTLSRVGMQMCWLLNSALMPEFSAAAARQDRRAQAVMVLATLLTSALLVIPYATLFALFGREVILIWTHGVIHSSPLLLLAMAGSILFGGFWYPLSNLILALNRHASYTIWFLVFAVISTPLTYFLSRSLGAAGAALPMLALDFAMLVTILILSQRILVPAVELLSVLPDFLSSITTIIKRQRWRRRGDIVDADIVPEGSRVP